MAATILVCDDQAALRELVTAALAGGPYSIFEASDGDESLALARALLPDVVVLDLVMPGRSGLDVLAEIRRDPRLATTSVIMCTASTNSLGHGLAGDFGADRYLPKPFSPIELAVAVEDLLGGRQT